MVENGRHDGPPTHAVTFVWLGQEVINNFWFQLYYVSSIDVKLFSQLDL